MQPLASIITFYDFEYFGPVMYILPVLRRWNSWSGGQISAGRDRSVIKTATGSIAGQIIRAGSMRTLYERGVAETQYTGDHVSVESHHDGARVST